MKIDNIRLGFATNSSSSHSVVIMDGRNTSSDMLKYISADCNYGWENFVLASNEEKMKYFATALLCAGDFDGLCKDEDDCISMNDKVEIVYNLTGVRPHEDSYIDHQSNPGPINLDKDYIEFIKQILLDDRILICGGNDNGEPYRPSNILEEFDLGDLISKHKTIRTKINNDAIILFNSTNGNKIRLTKDNKSYDKSSTPELVDVKITDYCPYGCEFCYQGSTKEGNHASLESIEKIFQTLQRAGTFEVAIGGGEPTKHPEFKEIIEMAAQYDIVPNFTTFGVDWLKDDQLLNVLGNHIGGVGVSVHSIDDVNKVKKIFDCFRQHNRLWQQAGKLLAQHVVGTHDITETANIIRAFVDADMPMLLLGYKEEGFGANFTKYDLSDLPLVIKLMSGSEADIENRRFDLSVDTAFLEQFPNFVDVLNIPSVLYTKYEGKFSCYIDAVTGKMGPSSYCKPEKMTDLPKEYSEFIEIYQTY